MLEEKLSVFPMGEKNDGRLTLKVATKEPSRACQNSGPQTLAPTYVAVLTAIGPGVI